MPSPLSVQTLGNGANLASIDGFGNLVLAGSASVGKALSLAKQATPPVQVPGQLQLYSPDGLSLSMIGQDGTAGRALLPAWANPVVSAGPVTVTGVTAKTLLATGITVPAGTLAAGQSYSCRAWGRITTTVDTQTVTLELDLGSTSVMNWGAQEPNSGAVVTGAAWFLEIFVNCTGGQVNAAGWNGLNYSFSVLNETDPTVISNTPALPFTLNVTPSDVAVSITMNGFVFQRTA
jgi:hypothetical protein